MQWRHAIAALALAWISAVGFQAKADPAVHDVYWVWRGGVRVWVGGPHYAPPPYYAPPPVYYAPPPYAPYSYYGRAPYRYGGRGYWHRRWYGGGWRYW